MIGINNYIRDLKLSLTNIDSSSNIRPILSPAEFILSSRTWTCFIPGIYRISCMGAGGSGAAIYSTSGQGNASCGGGGGGFCEKTILLNVNEQLNIVVGAGGAGVTSSVDGSGVNGNDGGNSTVIGNNISLTANGGLKGQFLLGTSTTKIGGSGGSASGGDINFSGGKGGDIYAYVANKIARSGGGGAPGSPYGIGGAGGDANVAGAHMCSGGGAVGGFKGGTQTAGSGCYFSGGAGTGGNGSANVDNGSGGFGGKNRLGILTIRSIDNIDRSTNVGFDTPYNPLRNLSGGGGNGAANTSAEGTNGGSGGGSGATSVNVLGPLVGGGGGSMSLSAPVTLTSSSNVIFGGGSGGSTCQYTGPAMSARGGNGLVVIELIAQYLM